METPTPELEDRGDYFGGTWTSAYGDVDVSVDRPDLNDETCELLGAIACNLDSWIAASLAYFDSVKQQYSVAYIDDLCDPHIICSPNDFSIYWSSAAGEVNAEGTIAVDFDGETRMPTGLTIAD